jgi:thioredoxin 1
MAGSENADLTAEMNADNFDALISKKGVVLVDCWAPWCGNCDQFAKVYRRVAARHPTHLFATLNTQEQEKIRDRLGIQHIPSLLLYRDGLLLFNEPGNYDEATLDDIITQAEGLDMEVVRAEMAAQQSDSSE